MRLPDPLSALRRHGVEARLVARLALPVVFTNLLQTLVNVADVVMVGRLGPIEVAAVGMAQMVRMLLMVGVLSVTTGAMVMAAQARGAYDDARLSAVARQALTLAVLFGAALGTLGFLSAEPLLGFMSSGASPEAVSLGTSYLRILFLGAPLMALTFSVTQLMQGAGDTLTPLVLVGSINVLNVAFNALFIFGLGPFPALGVDGAAYGTVAARAIGVVAGVWLLASGRNVVRLGRGSFLPYWPMVRTMVGIGVPAGTQGVLQNVSGLLVMRIVTSTSAGAYGAAAMSIGMQVASLGFMPGVAVSVAATSLVGQALGAWRPDLARLRGNLSIVLGMAIMALPALPMVAFAPQIVRLFEPSAHPIVVEGGASFLRIHGSAQPLIAVTIVASGALRGAGDTMAALIAAVIGRALLVVPLAYLLALVLGFELAGVWWGLLIGVLLQGALVLHRWRGRGWLDVAVRTSELYRTHLRHLAPPERTRYLNEVRTPLMAPEGARERVEPEQVRYVSQGGDVVVRFADGSFTTERREHVTLPGEEMAEREPAASA
ncbi:MAG: MATE family efflux transporter [Trueperaceae bacterium]